MTDASLPPTAAAMRLVSAFQQSQVVKALIELDVLDRLAGAPAMAGQLAEAAKADAASMARLLRAAQALGLLTTSPDGTYALTAVGRALTAEAPGSLLPVARFYLSPWVQESWSAVAGAVRTGKSAVVNQLGVTSVFEVYGRTPELAALFDGAMTALSAATGPAVAAAYDYSQARLCIDVGGGEGRLLAAILSANPGVSGLLFELPLVAEKGRAALSRWGLTDRCQVATGDMFSDPIPTGGDLYIMAHVLHDWEDARALRILHAVRAAIGEGAKLLLVERVMPEPIAATPEHQASALADMNMMVRTGGVERTEDEWRALLGQAAFELTRVLPTAGPNSLVEARPV